MVNGDFWAKIVNLTSLPKFDPKLIHGPTAKNSRFRTFGQEYEQAAYKKSYWRCEVNTKKVKAPLQHEAVKILAARPLSVPK